MASHPFRTAVEAGDFDAAIDLLAPDVTFNSPAVHRPYAGKESVGGLLRLVGQTLEDFRYVGALASEDAAEHCLVFRARVGDRELQGIDLVRSGADGLITDFTVMIRPLSGLVAVAQALGPKVEAAGLKPAPVSA